MSRNLCTLFLEPLTCLKDGGWGWGLGAWGGSIFFFFVVAGCAGLCCGVGCWVFWTSLKVVLGFQISYPALVMDLFSNRDTCSTTSRVKK